MAIYIDFLNSYFRNKRAIMKDESRIIKQSTKPVMPRNTVCKAKDRTVSKLVDEMEELGKFICFV